MYASWVVVSFNFCIILFLWTWVFPLLKLYRMMGFAMQTNDSGLNL